MFDLQKHPEWPQLLDVKNQFLQAGYKIYLVGGCVRDLLLGYKPKDFDFATSATPDQMQALFSKTNDIGKDFGTIQVVLASKTYEITTFRKDLTYEDGRHPVGVVFSDEIEDAKRRDFTMNALFYDLQSQKIIDHVEGLQDIQAKIIRFIGNAEERIEEDKLRLLRALRFVAALGFDLEAQTLAAVKKHVNQLTQVSRERIHEEVGKLIAGDYFYRAIPYLRETAVLDILFSSSLDISKLKDFLDASRRDFTKLQVAFSAPTVQLFSILFYGLLLRSETVDWRQWRWSKDLYSSVLLFRLLLRKLQTPLSKGELMQCLQSLEGNLLVLILPQLSIDAKNQQVIQTLYLQSLPFEVPLPEPLVNGNDLLKLGYKPNKSWGDVLETLYRWQLEHNVRSKELLLEKIKDFLS